MWNSLPDYVVMPDKHKHNLLILSKTVLMHIGNTEIFYFIIVQPTQEPESRIICFEYVKINACLSIMMIMMMNVFG